MLLAFKRIAHYNKNRIVKTNVKSVILYGWNLKNNYEECKTTNNSLLLISASEKYLKYIRLIVFQISNCSKCQIRNQ